MLNIAVQARRLPGCLFWSVVVRGMVMCAAARVRASQVRASTLIATDEVVIYARNTAGRGADWDRVGHRGECPGQAQEDHRDRRASRPQHTAPTRKDDYTRIRRRI